MIIFILAIILWVCILQSNQIENYDGIGKSFGRYYTPNGTCYYGNDCYPGMYWK